MSDMHIGKTAHNKKIGGYEQVSDYQKLKNEYEKFLKQAEKSDMANSLTMKQKQLEMLQKLREAALKDNCYGDFDMIDDEIAFISKSIDDEEAKGTSSIGYFADSSFNIQKNTKNDLVSLFAACKNSKGEIDNETRRIVLAFKNMDISPNTLAKLVDKCRGVGEVIEEETTKSVEKLCNAKISPDVIFQAVDESVVHSDSEVGKMDFSWLDDMLTYKSIGVSDLDSLKFAQTLNKNYENKSDVFYAVSKFLEAGFDTKIATELIKICSAVDKTTGLTKVSKQSINSLVSMKKNLLSTRTNERDERQNPINKLGEVIFTYDDTVIVMKDDKIVEIIDRSDDSVNSVRRAYDEVASEVENSIVLDFARKYKNKDGEIDKNALRTFSVLRNSGVTYDNLLQLSDECLEKDSDKHYSINTGKVNAITTLKKSGALSPDLLTILSSIEQDNEGHYSEKDISNACDLTKFIIAGKEVAELLPFVRDNEKVKSFICDFSNTMERKDSLLPLVMLVSGNGDYDSNASEIIYNLAESFLNVENSEIKEQEFVPYAEKVVSLSKSMNADKVDDNSTNVCIAMCRNNQSADNILKAIEMCKDEYGYPSESLADIVWDMCKQNSTFKDIVELINICKPVNGILDLERAAVISDLLNNDCRISDVIAFAQSLGTN